MSQKIITITPEEFEESTKRIVSEALIDVKKYLDKMIDVKLENQHLRIDRAAKYIARSRSFLYQNKWIPRINGLFKVAHLNIYIQSNSHLYTDKEVKQRFLEALKESDYTAYEEALKHSGVEKSVNSPVS